MKTPWYARVLYAVIDFLYRALERLTDGLMSLKGRVNIRVARKYAVKDIKWTAVYWADKTGRGRYRWKDLSGNKNHLKQRDPDKRPTLHISNPIFNEHDSVHFDGSAQFFAVSAEPLTEEQKEGVTAWAKEYFGLKYTEETDD